MVRNEQLHGGVYLRVVEAPLGNSRSVQGRYPLGASVSPRPTVRFVDGRRWRPAAFRTSVFAGMRFRTSPKDGLAEAAAYGLLALAAVGSFLFPLLGQGRLP